MKRKPSHSAVRTTLGREAFTLLEVLTSCGVTALISVICFQLLSSSTHLWQQSEARMDAAREGRATLDLLSRDLRTLLPPSGDSATLWLQRSGVNPGAPGKDEVYFLTVQQNSGPSDLCAVGYRIVWLPEARGYALMRRFLDSEAVHTILKTNGEAITLERLFAGQSGVEEEVARYISDFALRPGRGFTAESAFPNRAYSDALPEWVSIGFRVVSPREGRRLASLPITQETWATPESDAYQKWIKPHQTQFRTLVSLPSGGMR